MFPNKPDSDQQTVGISNFYTVKDVAARLKMSPSKLTTHCRKQEIDHIKIGRKYLFDEPGILKFVNQHRNNV